MEKDMECVNLGRAGVKVSRLCLGCMNFGGRTDGIVSPGTDLAR